MFYLVKLPHQHEDSFRLFLQHMNKFSIFDVKTPEAVPAGHRYSVFLDVTHDMIYAHEDRGSRYDWIVFGAGDPLGKNASNSIFQMPERVWNDSAKGLVHWIISFPQESDTEERILFEKLRIGLNTSNSRNITFLTGCRYSSEYKRYFETKHNVNLAHYNVLFEYAGISNVLQHDIDMVGNQMKKSIKSIHQKENRRYKGVMYNRMKRNHRLYFLSLLKKNNILNDTIWSCGVGHVGDWIHQFPDLKAEATYFSKLENKSAEEFTNQNKLDLNNNQANSVNFEHGRMSYLHIVSESNTTNRTFITEKSYKPFFMMQPFVMLGNQGNVQELRNMGYDTFDKWIDHSYDTEPDDVKRWTMVFSETKRLYTYSQEQWSNMMVDMSEALAHNITTVMTPQVYNTSDIINILLKFHK